jgi:hypothetical protein
LELVTPEWEKINKDAEPFWREMDPIPWVIMNALSEDEVGAHSLFDVLGKSGHVEDGHSILFTETLSQMIANIFSEILDGR